MPFHRPIPESQRKPHPSSSGIETLVEAEKLMQIAILLPSAAFIGWLFGALADKWLHQTWISLAGIVFGGISGLVYAIRLALAAGVDSPAKNKPENGEDVSSTDPTHK